MRDFNLNLINLSENIPDFVELMFPYSFFSSDQQAYAIN